MPAARSIDLGDLVSIQEAPTPKVYIIKTGKRHLHQMEGGFPSWHPENHVISINEGTGDLMINGTLGCYAYCWPSHCRGSESLHSFLSGLNKDYFLGKTARQPWQIFDADKACRMLRAAIIRDRRDMRLSKEEAREAWDEVDNIAHCQTEESFMSSAYHSSNQWVADNTGSDGNRPTTICPSAERFWTEVWTPFAAAVLKPIAAAERDSRLQLSA